MKNYKFFTIAIILISFQHNLYAFDNINIWKNLNQQNEEDIKNQKQISGYLSNKIYYNGYDQNKNQGQYNESVLASELGLNLKLNDNFVIKTVADLDRVSQKLEASGSLKRRNDQFFQNEGAYIYEAVLNYNYKDFSALAGKFATNFGTAWKSSDGIWTNIIGKNYRVDNKMGFGAIQKFGDVKTNGQYVFGFGAFRNMSRNLDGSIITKKDLAIKTDDMPGDVGGLKSYVGSMDVYYQFAQKEKLSYHFAYANLAVDKKYNDSDKNSDQKSFVGNLNYKYPISDQMLLDGFSEYAILNNFQGQHNSKINFLTVNLTTYYKDFFLTLAKGYSNGNYIADNNTNTYIKEISLGYKFDHLSPTLKNLSLAVGYNQRKTSQTNYSKVNAFGVLLKHSLEF